VTGKGIAVVNVAPTTSPEAAATSNLIDRLRTSVIPAAESNTSLHVYVGGITATFGDFATVLGHKLPLFVAVIIGLGFLLLLLAFRSLLVPATAAVMNLLAAGAAFGVVIAIFQFGWGLQALNLGQAGPVESFLPVLLLAVLFGLSTDYEVFLVSRIREEWSTSKDNHQAVSAGQATTGGVIVAAATIMICVFTAFILTGQQVIGEFGIGLAVAVLLDAFILRTVLVPAAMHLFGKANCGCPTGWTTYSRTYPSSPPGNRPRTPPRLPARSDKPRQTESESPAWFDNQTRRTSIQDSEDVLTPPARGLKGARRLLTLRDADVSGPTRVRAPPRPSRACRSRP
jgi:RND superfamily putative drug exporter